MSTDNEKHRDEQHFEEGEETPPRGVHAMAIVRWALLALMALAAIVSIYSYVGPLFGQEARSTKPAAKYFCPMHPQITSDVPGECPICHMTLEPMPADRQSAGGPEAPPRSPLKPAASAAPSANPAPAQSPSGTVPITLALDRVQAIGVRTAPVERLDTSDVLRVTAAVEASDQGRAEVHPRAAGLVLRAS